MVRQGRPPLFGITETPDVTETDFVTSGFFVTAGLMSQKPHFCPFVKLHDAPRPQTTRNAHQTRLRPDRASDAEDQLVDRGLLKRQPGMIEPLDAAFHAGSASIIFAKPAEHFRACVVRSA
jgi:hypothetical protein